MINRYSLAAAAVVGLAGAAAAQTAPAAPTDVRTFGDYVVRCFPVKSASPCDMYQEQDAKETGQRIISFSLAFVPSASRYAIQIAVPLGVSIPKGLVIQASGITTGALNFRRCDRAGCYVEMVMDRATVDKLARSEAAAKVHVVADSGKSVDLNLSLNGFSSAHDAMVESARSKASAAAAPPAGSAGPARSGEVISPAV